MRQSLNETLASKHGCDFCQGILAPQKWKFGILAEVTSALDLSQNRVRDWGILWREGRSTHSEIHHFSCITRRFWPLGVDCFSQDRSVWCLWLDQD